MEIEGDAWVAQIVYKYPEKINMAYDVNILSIP